MTALITALILSLPGLQATNSRTAQPDLHILEIHSVAGNQNQGIMRHDELSMRDWKLLMPNWKPKTTAFAIVAPVQVENFLS